MRLARWKGTQQGAAVVVCGLAGALAPGLPRGTVLIPEQVGLTDGQTMQCDPELVQALVKAAHTLHYQPDTRPLLTAPSLVIGNERDDWYQKGFVAADMETGLLAGRHLRVATVRVVLDSPEYSISPDWLQPMKAVLQPALWREMFWLAQMAPRCALKAAEVLKALPGTWPDGMFVE
jgi:hypothetical protein